MEELEKHKNAVIRVLEATIKKVDMREYSAFRGGNLPVQRAAVNLLARLNDALKDMKG